MIYFKCLLVILFFAVSEVAFIYAYEDLTGPLNCFELFVILFVFPSMSMSSVTVLLTAEKMNQMDRVTRRYMLRCAACDHLVDLALAESSYCRVNVPTVSAGYSVLKEERASPDVDAMIGNAMP